MPRPTIQKQFEKVIERCDKDIAILASEYHLATQLTEGSENPLSLKIQAARAWTEEVRELCEEYKVKDKVLLPLFLTRATKLTERFMSEFDHLRWNDACAETLGASDDQQFADRMVWREHQAKTGIVTGSYFETLVKSVQITIASEAGVGPKNTDSTDGTDEQSWVEKTSMYAKLKAKKAQFLFTTVDTIDEGMTEVHILLDDSIRQDIPNDSSTSNHYVKERMREFEPRYFRLLNEYLDNSIELKNPAIEDPEPLLLRNEQIKALCSKPIREAFPELGLNVRCRVDERTGILAASLDALDAAVEEAARGSSRGAA